MDFVYRRSYRGRVRAVIFDLAGTTVDFGCRAPVAALVELFQRHGAEISVEEVRQSMGMHKKDHLRTILQSRTVADQWRASRGATPDEADVERLFTEFVPIQTAAISRHSDVIPGVSETVSQLRKRGIRIGATTGYSREMIRGLLRDVAASGFQPDHLVCADDVPAGRPAPWMAVTSAMKLGIYPLEACVKVGDTVADIEEGLNAGMWTVGVTWAGNEVGLSERECESLGPDELTRRVTRATERLGAAGAHFVIESVQDLVSVIETIDSRMAAGAKP
ncbi:phosphonoacetaldehyde hydrolase [uncultured Paludibaculum sp.]|uniref:phosphonoacetaldehyde hydrolase n=1 Tax=uncultured Paludibaculum sp. TaxID=1765020 RepID=UPI002AABD87B|nr:phosphonoacetaldehyde hydrolase [uncultured Paludibaculum sp.]